MVHKGKTNGRNRDHTAHHTHGGPARSNHLVHSHVHNTRKGETYSLLASSVQYKRARWNHIQYGAESLPAGVFNASDIFADIKLSGAGVDNITNFTLRLEVSNIAPADPDPTVGALFPQLPFYFFDRIEIQPDGGTTEDILYPEDMYYDFLEVTSSDEKAVIGRALGMNTNAPTKYINNTYTDRDIFDEDGVPIVAGQTREFLIPVKSMLTQAKIFLPCAQQMPRYRFYFANQPICSDSDTANGAAMNLVAMEGIVSGILYEDAIRIDLVKHYCHGKIISRVMVHERQLESIASVVPLSLSADKNLNVFNGHYSMFYVTLLKGNAVLEGVYDSYRTKAALPGGAGSQNAVPTDYSNFIPIIRLTLTDNDGNPIFYNNFNGNFARFVGPTWQSTKCVGYLYKNIYPMYFALDNYKTICTGENTGGIALNTEFSLKVVPGRFETTGENDYTLRFNARRYALLTMEKGAFKVTKL